MAIQLITANDIDQQTLIIEDDKLKVNVSSVVPAAKADKFLKAVQMSQDGTKLELTVGTEGADDAPIEVPVANIINGLASVESLQEAKDKINELETRIEALDAGFVARVAVSPEVVAAIKEAITGESVLNDDGTVKGYLIALD